MFGWPALSARRLRCKVISNGIIPDIANNIKISVFVHNTPYLFDIPAITKDYDINLRKKIGHDLSHHRRYKLQFGCVLFSHAVSKEDCQIDILLFPPHMDTEHEADKTMPVKVVGAII